MAYQVQIYGYVLSNPEKKRLDNFNDSKKSLGRAVVCSYDSNVIEEHIVIGVLQDPAWRDWWEEISAYLVGKTLEYVIVTVQELAIPPVP